MKPSPTPKRQSRTRREQGIALVTVLAILTLTAVLVMAFFTISRSELASSTVYARGVEASHLAKSAVDLVIHQIRSATERPGVAWASQPGMIRTWGSAGNEVSQCFKLYSDESMVVGEGDVFNDVGDLQGLGAQVNDVRYVDLNAPVIRTYNTTTEYFYPIIDPRAAAGATKVEGFDLVNSPFNSQGNRFLPMPVKWIYQLQDGTMGTLAGGGQTGTFQPLASGGANPVGTPSAANPIVARFAFWADDETAKLNVNTAAGGVAWDTPRAGGLSDRNYGLFQPVANEFQRYPGHPATTSMIHVLFPGVALPNSENYQKASAELYYDLIPRIQKGGSIGGGFAGTANRYGLISPIQPDEDRLFATIDEFIFRAPQVGFRDGRTGADFLRREQPAVGVWPPLRPSDLSRLQFFLTATSKAPEVTVFNTPKISVWPSFHGDPERTHAAYFTSYDRRLRFCAEVGRRDETAPADARAPQDTNRRQPAMYHFQRKNAASSTKDYDQIPRNRELYAYLQELMAAPIPGQDVSDGVRNWNSLRGKYGDRNSNQIITEIFDYIRSVNLFDDLLMKQQGIQRITSARIPSAPVAISRNFANNNYFGYWPPAAPNEGTHVSFTPGRLAIYNPPDLNNGHAAYIGADTHAGHGQVAPIVIRPPGGGQETKGFGRFFGVREVGVAVLTCAQDNGFPGGESRRAVGVNNLGSTNETWSTQGKRVTGRNGLRVDSDGAEPTWDYSNVPPLSILPAPALSARLADSNLKELVRRIYQLTVSNDDLNANNVQINSQPPMGALDFFGYVTTPENWNRTLQVDTPLTGGATQVQAILLVALYSPSKGWTQINPDFRLEVDVQRDFELGPTSSGGALAVGFPSGRIKTPHAGFRRAWHGRDSGGTLEPRMLMVGHSRLTPARPDLLAYGLMARTCPAPLNLGNVGPENLDLPPPQADPAEGPESFVYPWVGRTITIGDSRPGDPFSAPNRDRMTLNGGQVTIRIYPDGGSRTNGADAAADKDAIENAAPADYVQSVTINFDSTTVPLPILAGASYGHRREGPQAGQWSASPKTEARPRENWCWNRDGAFKTPAGRTPSQGFDPTDPAVVSGTGRGRLGMVFGNQGYGIAEAPTLAMSGHSVCQSVDVIRSYVIPHGDDRIVFAHRDVPAGVFQKHLNYDAATRLVACNFSTEAANQGYGRAGIPGSSANAVVPFRALVNPAVANVPPNRRPILPDNFDLNFNQWGDWDNGVAGELDGPMINKPDEGNAMGVAYNDFIPKPWIPNSPARAFIPYFSDTWIQEPAGPGLWSPNRIMPGAGMLGSLPTGVFSRSGAPTGSQPWQTLLFRRVGGSPQDSARGLSPLTNNVHPGWEHPRDHYILDFFWMPVVEPYSISEPLATAGKINMNYAIQPFDYIKRKSSLLGVFSSEELLTVPNQLNLGPGSPPNHYKDGEGMGGNPAFDRTRNTGGNLRNVSLRSWINSEETLRQFDRLFGEPGGNTPPQIFRTSSQICEQWLVPGQPVRGTPYGVNNITLENVSQWYNPQPNSAAGNRSFGLVGDNARERPYTNIVSRLTTKSNTFNIHYRAQIIRQSPLSPSAPGTRRSDAEFAIFDASADKMVGEYRGSSIVERYIDPNDVRIPDYAFQASRGSLNLGSPNEVETLDKFYRFRIVSEKRFAP